MRAIIASSPGDESVLTIIDRPVPTPGPHDVVIAVQATAVNRADLLQRRGFYPPPPGVTDVLGLECAGTIAATGEAVTEFMVGDPVCALLSGGGYAEQVCVPAAQVLPVPAGLTITQAAALPEVVCTVWSNLVLTAGLCPGQSVLLHGGAGGIGSMAIQLAKQCGATVITTVGSAEKAAQCLALGADHAINYRTEDFVDQVHAHLPDGVDVVLDIMGAKYLAQNVKALTKGGQLVIIGLQGGVKAEVNLAQVVSSRLSIHGTSLRSRPAAEKAEIVQAVRDDVWPWFAAGTIQPVIDQELPWQQVAQAHRRMAASEHHGKIVLRVATS